MISYQNLKIWNLLNQKHKYSMFLFLFLMFLTMILETLSISILYPVVSIFINRNSDINFINYLMEQFNYQNSFYFILILLLFVFIIKNIFIFFFTFFKHKLSSNIHYYLATSLLKKYINNNYLFHTIRNSSLLIRNITHEVPNIHNVILQFMILFTEIFVLIGIFFFLIYINPLVTVYIFFMATTVLAIHYFFINNYVNILGKRKVYHTGELIKHFMQGLGGIKLTKILGKHNFFINNFNIHMLEYTNLNYIHRTITEVPRLVVEILALISIILLMYFLIFVQNNELSSVLAFLTVYLAALIRSIPSISRIISALAILSSLNKSVEVIYNDLTSNDFKDTYLLNKKQNNNIKFQNKGNLNIENISFNYPNREKIINNISFSIKTGEVIGILGQSGSGKSTLVDLIIGILEITDGKIKFNNENIFSDINNWKQKIGYVPQNIYLTDDSIINNIAFGIEHENIDKERVISLLESLNMTDYISKLPDGIDTKVGERGVQISGGQLQRIGIARALYHEPSIIILDEATSALDLKNEDLIITQINNLRKNKMIIIISHKLNSVKICDRVYKLENSFLKLLKKNEQL